MQISPSPPVRASWLAFNISLFSLPHLQREGAGRERNILKRNLQKRHGSYLTKIQPKQAQLGDYKCGGRSRAGSGSGSAGEAAAAPPAPGCFSRKRKQKVMLCAGSVWGGRAPPLQPVVPRLLGSPLGSQQVVGGQQLFHGSLPQLLLCYGCSPPAACASVWKGAEGSVCFHCCSRVSC